MPIFSYICEDSHVTKKFIRQVKDVPQTVECPECKKDAKKTLGEPMSVSKVIIDNGLMPRAIEVHPDIGKINVERSKKNYKED